MNDDEEFPTVGLTAYDAWFTELLCVMVTSGFINVSEMLSVDREAFNDYYESGYTPQDAFEEDLTCYGD